MVAPSSPGKFSARIAAIVVLIPLGIIAWYVAPWFLPMWAWQKLDFEKLARDKGVPVAELRREFTMVVRHAPRGDDDPVPWQIVSMEPVWDKADEHQYLVRATVVSDRTGMPPSGLLLNSGHRRDRYFRITAWRLPPGSLDFNRQRPVVVYRGGSLEKLDIPQAESADGTIRDARWENDDLEVDDGWMAPGER